MRRYRATVDMLDAKHLGRSDRMVFFFNWYLFMTVILCVAWMHVMSSRPVLERMVDGAGKLAEQMDS